MINNKLLFLIVICLFGVAGQAQAACDKPDGVGVEGEIIYNRAWKTMQFCDGDKWVGMATTVKPNGPDNSVQFNDDGALAGSANLTFDGTNLKGAIRDVTGAPLRMCSGRSPTGAWVATGAGITLTVNTSGCGFTTAPRYFTAISSVGVPDDLWWLTGTTSIYLPTATKFVVNLHRVSGSGTFVDRANTNGWFVDWIAIGN